MPAGSTTPEIILVRHGPSAHVERGWIDADGLRRWMIAYDAAEIAVHRPPPPHVVELGRTADLLVTSDLPRAVASAAILAPGREVHTSPLLREAPIESPESPIPRLAGLRLPLRGWAFVMGARWLRASWRGGPPPGVDAAALSRADAAAEWVAGLAVGHGRLLAVTHTIARGLIAASLARRGWRGPDRRPYHEWSTWRLHSP